MSRRVSCLFWYYKVLSPIRNDHAGSLSGGCSVHVGGNSPPHHSRRKTCGPSPLGGSSIPLSLVSQQQSTQILALKNPGVAREHEDFCTRQNSYTFIDSLPRACSVALLCCRDEPQIYIIYQALAPPAFPISTDAQIAAEINPTRNITKSHAQFSLLAEETDPNVFEES